VISAGRLTVRACLHEGRLGGIEVELERPPVTRLFIGQLPAAVLRTLPALYSVCTHAQRATAGAALAAAAGEAPGPADDAGLWRELVHEHLWRLLLDWPPALGLPPEKEAFAAWRATRNEESCVAETERLLQGALCDIAEKCQARMVDRDCHVPAGGRALFPAAWLAGWRAGGEAPTLHAPPSISAAYRGRVAGLKSAAAAMAAGAPYPIAFAGGDGWGVAQTITARGILTHGVRLTAGRVADYRIWAPTDCFFADAGMLSGLLDAPPLASVDAARQLLDQAVLALDPCVPCVVELKDA